MDTITGVYYLEQVTYFEVFRFYCDGMVISASIAKNGSLIDLWPAITQWFNRDFDHQGKYILTGDTIQFSVTSPVGVVAYQGKFTGERLVLSSISHINGYNTKDNTYIKLENMAVDGAGQSI